MGIDKKLLTDRNHSRQELHQSTAGLNYVLEVFGDHLAQREGYGSGLDGLEACRYYLLQKHHWLPREVLALSCEEMRFALSEEMQGWTLPPEARV